VFSLAEAVAVRSVDDSAALADSRFTGTDPRPATGPSPSPPPPARPAPIAIQLTLPENLRGPRPAPAYPTIPRCKNASAARRAEIHGRRADIDHYRSAEAH
jgi:hypothetical protein